ncbi:DUF2474 family protein [Jannaschia rubra]|uniref:DUF2474 domain-containing protein n=1 Tax=Jannaschia rubra TaxID=282197 RepID=A0A0M6XVH2_9RHOB|nr:DUF2474 family protein [Jannaschia rubra]CTQ34283.1 hypothetical protein JAN5088_03077 [Jannaschia rubra]SFG18841.1 Protein of unknown function [Jannaschia rubra]
MAPAPRDPDAPRPPLVRRLGWFVAIWVMSVLVLGTVAWVIRLFIV